MVNKQKIVAGAESTNIQGKEVTVNHYNGMTYQEVKDIALDIFERNFYTLSEKAADIAKARAEELTAKYLQTMFKEYPDEIKKFEDPDLQYALFNAQKGFARMGNEELSDLLVDMLIDRTTLPDNSLMQVVLNESISVASKLTINQLDILSLVFLIKHSIKYHVVDFISLEKHVKDYIMPFTQNLSKNNTNYQHLIYAGCGVRGSNRESIQDIFRTNYPGVFSKGFHEDKFEDIVLSDEKARGLFISCLHDKSLYQVGAEDHETIKEYCEENEISTMLADKIIRLQQSNLFSSREAKEFLCTLIPEFESAIELWEDSIIQLLELTSVGIALAHANLKRKMKIDTDLSVWIK